MSTPARYAEAGVQPASAMPAASTALVPVAGLRGSGPVPEEKPVNAHRMFYGLGYTGLALVWTSMWLNAQIGNSSEAVAGVGGMFTALGGLGVFIHTVVKPNERKVRHLLLAIGSLALTIASYPVVERISREMYANAAVVRLQPLAETLARDTRIIDIGVLGGSVMFNGYFGPEHGFGSAEGRRGVDVLDDALAQDGISREEYRAYQRALRRVGMRRARRTATTVAFAPAGPREPWLLYVVPGHPLPPAHALLDESGTFHSEPLGGPWYMVLSGSR